MTIFCERAKTRMKELHITTRQLAKSIGMTESTVSRYLSGNRSPKIEELVKIAETLECSADYLLGLKESEMVVQKEIFKEIVYVFSDHNLVTVMLLPNDLKNSVKKTMNIKRKVST